MQKHYDIIMSHIAHDVYYAAQNAANPPSIRYIHHHSTQGFNPYAHH